MDKIRKCSEGKLSLNEGWKRIFSLQSQAAYNQRPFHIFMFSQQYKYTLHTKPWEEITGEKLHSCTTAYHMAFWATKATFSQHHPSGTVRHRFNCPNPSCCHSWEQDSGSACVRAQARGPWQLATMQPSYIKEPYILGHSVGKCSHATFFLQNRYW